MKGFIEVIGFRSGKPHYISIEQIIEVFVDSDDSVGITTTGNSLYVQESYKRIKELMETAR